MAGLFDAVRGEGEFKRVRAKEFDLFASSQPRVPASFLTFSLNRDIPNWPWPAPSPWQRISLPPNSGTPGQQTNRVGGMRIKDAWTFDWIDPGPFFISPSCGAAATGEYALTYSEGISIAIEFPDLEEFRVAGDYSEMEQKTTNVTMDSGQVQKPDPRFVYQLKPLIEVLLFKRIEDYFGPSGLGQFFNFYSYGITPFSYGYERTLYVEGLSYAVARMPCTEQPGEPNPEDGSADDEQEQQDED